MDASFDPKRSLNALFPWIIPAGLLSAWFLASHTEYVPGYLFPHPFTVARSGFDYIFGAPGQGPYAGRFQSDATASLMRVYAGFVLAAAAGVPLGMISGRLAVVNRLISGVVNGLRSVPGICWLPLAMVWFGIGLKTTIFLVALAAFFPAYLNTAGGARRVNPTLYHAGAMMGASRLRGVFHILLPSAMPQIVTGLRLSMGVAWAYLVLGELTGVPDGLGAAIMDARMMGRTDIIVAGIILIAVIGRLSDLLLIFVMKLCFKSARRMS